MVEEEISKQEKEELVILETADALEEMTKSKGWRYLDDYLRLRMVGLKNKLVRINLDKELFEAAKTQGKIEALDSIFNRISNVIKRANLIKKEKEISK